MPKKHTPTQRVVTFHNKVNPNFRQIHVDGAFGGITPPGFINMSFYAERFPMPKSTNYLINENNTLGEKVEDSRDSKTGVIREYEFGIYCDLKTAINIRNFLNDRILELENQNPKP
jgi:hypothetical protein